jgi:hypothetical protein
MPDNPTPQQSITTTAVVGTTFTVSTVTSISPTYRSAVPVESKSVPSTESPPASGSRMVTTTQQVGLLKLRFTPRESTVSRVSTK